MDVISDYLRPRAAEARRDIISVMKKHGYYDKIFSLSSEADRVKSFLKLMEDRSSTHPENLADKTIPNPRLMPLFPGIRNKYTHKIDAFPELKCLEKNYQTIRDEAFSLDEENNYFEYGKSFMGSKKWSIHIFSYMGVDVSNNCLLCPKTTEFLQSIPNRCRIYPWGDAIFSVLQPGAHIPAHTSVDNLRVRCMFGVDVPAGCEMRVGTITTYWENGKTLLFDDSFEHEVWHRGQSRRIVLIFDLWHPDLTPFEIELLTIGLTHVEVREIIYDALQNSTDEYNKYLKLASSNYTRHKNYYKYWKDETCYA